LCNINIDLNAQKEQKLKYYFGLYEGKGIMGCGATH